MKRRGSIVGALITCAARHTRMDVLQSNGSSVALVTVYMPQIRLSFLAFLGSEKTRNFIAAQPKFAYTVTIRRLCRLDTDVLFHI